MVTLAWEPQMKMASGYLHETAMSPIRETTTPDISGTITQAMEYLEIEMLINSPRDLYANNTTNRKFNYVRIS